MVVLFLLNLFNVRALVMSDSFYDSVSEKFRLYNGIPIKSHIKILENAKARQRKLSSQGFNFLNELEKIRGYNEESSSSRTDKRRNLTEEVNYKTNILFKNVISGIEILGLKAAKVVHRIDTTADAVKRRIGSFVKSQADRAAKTIALHITRFGSGLELEWRGLGYFFGKGVSKLINFIENSSEHMTFAPTEPSADIFFIGNFANVISSIDDRKNQSSYVNKQKKKERRISDQLQLSEFMLVSIGLIVTIYLLRCCRTKDETGSDDAFNINFSSLNLSALSLPFTSHLSRCCRTKDKSDSDETFHITFPSLNFSALTLPFTSLPSVNLPALIPSIDSALSETLSKLFASEEKSPPKASCSTST